MFDVFLSSSQKKKRKRKSDVLSISISEEGSTNSPPAKKQALIQASSPRSVTTTEEDSLDDQDAASSSQDSIPASSASVSPASVSSKSAKRNRGRTISQDGSECENQAPIRLTDELKSILEEDFRQVTKKRKLKGKIMITLEKCIIINFLIILQNCHRKLTLLQC